MNELQIIRDAISTALERSPDYRCSDLTTALKMVNENVQLGRLDPGQWCTEALVIAHTEDGLPSPYEYDFWERVTEIANQNGCKVQSFDVTHFSVGFFKELQLAPDVATRIQQGAKAASEKLRHHLEYALESNNISSPIEQLFFVCWEVARESSANRHDAAAHDLTQHVLFPQFPMTSDLGKQYLFDFAVLRFDPDRYRQLVREWQDRQDPYSDGNWIVDPYPKERDDECNENLRIVIELDSYKHHVKLSQSGFEYQTRRKRFLQHEGWRVFSFTGSQVNRDPMKCVQEIRNYLIKNRL